MSGDARGGVYLGSIDFLKQPRSPVRGIEDKQNTLFSYVSQEDRIPEHHPMRKLRELIDPILEKLSPAFEKMYAEVGRPSIPPEYLLRASLVQILYSIRSERLLMEELDYNLLFRWFVGLSMDDAVWDHSVFSKNRDRLLEADIAKQLLHHVVDLARDKQLLSDEHFTVDGTLIEAWAGHKSFVRKDTPTPKRTGDPGNPTIDFHGEKRTNDTHQSTTDPEARLYRKSKGKESKLSFLGHVVMDNRYGLVVTTSYTEATGTAERTAGTTMMKKVKGRGKRRLTLGADKNYDTKDFLEQMRLLNITLHAAQNTKRRGGSALDRRTTRHPGYELSQWKRKLVEEIFGWGKTVGSLRKIKYKGLQLGGWIFTFTNAVYNLIRIRNIIGAAT